MTLLVCTYYLEPAKKNYGKKNEIDLLLGFKKTFKKLAG